MIVSAELGHEPLARAVAAAAYDRGAEFVDVGYFDPYVKRARIAHADPETVEFVPPWYGQRLLEHADGRGARVTIAGPTAPGLLDDFDPELTGRDRLPFMREIPQIISARTTNWCIVPCPHPAWARLVFPDLSEEDALERLWQQLEHVLRLDEDDPGRAWDAAHGRARTHRRHASPSAGSMRSSCAGLAPSSGSGCCRRHRWLSADFVTSEGVRHFANLPTEEVFTTPDPVRTEGHVTSTRPLVLRDGSIIRGLKVKFEQGRAVGDHGRSSRRRAPRPAGRRRRRLPAG